MTKDLTVDLKAESRNTGEYAVIVIVFVENSDPAVLPVVDIRISGKSARGEVIGVINDNPYMYVKTVANNGQSESLIVSVANRSLSPTYFVRVELYLSNLVQNDQLIVEAQQDVKYIPMVRVGVDTPTAGSVKVAELTKPTNNEKFVVNLKW